MKTELEDRTKKFAVQIVKLIRTFPKTVDGIEVGRQLLKSGTSVGANYREANRAESKDDFIHKVGIAEKEASETEYWLEICEASNIGRTEEIKVLLAESKELLAILTTIGRKAKGRGQRIIGASAAAIVSGAVLFSLFRFSIFAFHFLP